MALAKKHQQIINRIARKYGRLIDLKQSPGLMIEILRDFGHVLDDDGGGGGGGGVSTIAVGGVVGEPPPPPPPDETGQEVRLVDVMKAVLRLQRDVAAIGKTLNQRERLKRQG